MNPLAKLFDDLIQKGFEFFGRYYSSYRGFVVENEDPDNFGRLKLKVPQIYGTQLMDYWAWPKGMFSGKGYGFQCTPQKGDMVFVEFEFGDPKKPIWSFGHFGRNQDSTKEKPKELEDIGNFWFKTPKGNLIEFDDTNNSIRITGSDGTTLVFKDGIQQLNGDDEPAVLGDKNEDVFKSIEDSLDIIKSYFQNIVTGDTAGVATLSSSYGVALTYVQQASVAQIQLNQNIADIKTKIPKTKSTKVKLG